MISQTFKNLIKRAKKEKVTLVSYCDICKMEGKFRGTPIRVIAMKKEFIRQHNHKVGFVKRFVKFVKGGK